MYGAGETLGILVRELLKGHACDDAWAVGDEV